MSHNTNRAIFRIRHPLRYHQLKKLRYAEKNYTLSGFDATRSMFVHVPKAAGVSISQQLYGNYGGGHCSVSEYRYIFNEEDFNSYFKFTFVRNPWDRLFSAYSFLQQGGFSKKDAHWYALNLAKYKTFEDFVMHWLSPEAINSYIHFNSQSSFLVLPENGTMPIDFLGYYENLIDDFAYVANRVNPNVGLQHLNKTDKKTNFKNSYTEAMIERVADVYKEDIKRFKYIFDNSSLSEQLSLRKNINIKFS